MVSQYPHTIIIQLQPEFEKDPSGNFQPKAGTGGTFLSECRAEPSKKKSTENGKDGEVVMYEYDVYMPYTNQVFNFGDTVEITFQNGKIFVGTYKGQPHNQFNTVLWV